MPRLTLDMQVLMDDDRELAVAVDQRDLAKWEAQTLPDKQYTRLRFLAWSAMTRSKQYIGPWDQFNEQDCVEVSDPPGAAVEAEDADDDAERLDPGQLGQSEAA